jgi:nucleotide-binding universal stress UspA family protein
MDETGTTPSPEDHDQHPETRPETDADETTTPAEQADTPHRLVSPIRLTPLVPRRRSPWILVEVDGTPAGDRALVWALHEAARREATVVAVGIVEDPADDPLGSGSRAAWRDSALVRDRVEAAVCHAIAETGVHGRVRTSVVERPLLEALVAGAHGADLVLVGAEGKALLRQAVPRAPSRRLARGA